MLSLDASGPRRPVSLDSTRLPAASGITRLPSTSGITRLPATSGISNIRRNDTTPTNQRPRPNLYRVRFLVIFSTGGFAGYLAEWVGSRSSRNDPRRTGSAPRWDNVANKYLTRKGGAQYGVTPEGRLIKITHLGRKFFLFFFSFVPRFESSQSRFFFWEGP